jgi:hypothetical protein
MTSTRRAQWYWSDWLGDQAVRRLTLAERGLWIDLLALAADGVPTGYVTDSKGRPLTHEEIARICNAGSPVEVAELIGSIVEKGAGSRDRTGRLFNRRMVRDAERSVVKRRAGHLGGVHTALVNKSNQALVQQMAQQVLEQDEQARRGPYLNKKDNSSTNSDSEIRAGLPQGVGEKETKSMASPHLAASLHRRGWV